MFAHNKNDDHGEDCSNVPTPESVSSCHPIDTYKSSIVCGTTEEEEETGYSVGEVASGSEDSETGEGDQETDEDTEAT